MTHWWPRFTTMKYALLKPILDLRRVYGLSLWSPSYFAPPSRGTQGKCTGTTERFLWYKKWWICSLWTHFSLWHDIFIKFTTGGAPTCHSKYNGEVSLKKCLQKYNDKNMLSRRVKSCHPHQAAYIWSNRPDTLIIIYIYIYMVTYIYFWTY